MNLSPSLQPLATDAAAKPAGPITRCEMANFRWEEAVSDERAAQYNDFVGEVDSHSAWLAEHKGQVTAYTHVAKDAPVCAETFLPVNALAHLREDLDNNFLLRLESFRGFETQPLMTAAFQQFWQRFFNSQKDLLKPNLSETDENLCGEFVRLWNNSIRLQSRPMFATFLNDFGGNLPDLINTDWPHDLRDRLGLSHFVGSPDAPIPVALVCYELDDVREAREMAVRKGAIASFARPTVLDSEMSAAFVPAPLFEGGETYGHTLDLTDTSVQNSFSPELLTYPIEYRRQHIKALGFITRGHALLDESQWLPARNRHVQALQQLPDCADFGEILA